MLARRALLVTGVAVLAAASTSLAASIRKSPPWISIESPVNPYDPATRGAVLLVHAQFREGSTQLADLNGTAEGLVKGSRRTIRLRFDSTSRLDVFGLRRQWPADGAWLLRVNLKETTAIVTLDASGNVATVRVPTESGQGIALPRAVSPREIDSTLVTLARR